MVARLGDVLYWAFSLIAFLVAANAAYSSFQGTYNREAALIYGGMAVVIWLIGRACRYVLAGR